MGKRSDFERVPRDNYPTPISAVLPLIPHLRPKSMFSEPCAGTGTLVSHLHSFGFQVQGAMDIDAPPYNYIQRGNALTDDLGHPEQFITNPPWDRDILHPLIARLSEIAPTWLLFDADWVHTRQSIPLMPRLKKIVSVGRVKWIPNSASVGKDNCCWHLFYKPSIDPPIFYGRMT